MIKSIPKEVKDVLQALSDAGFEAYIVGGCVRDLSVSRVPKDWDITTNAKPDEVQEIFPDSFYENDFGTVGVKVDPFLPIGKKDREHDVVEVTTYRIESTYTDKRRPDDVKFAKTLEEDLSRRDFTMNALAIKVENEKNEIVDLFGGREDIKNKLICAVGNPIKRFGEDALRMMRAVRLGAELNFTIEDKTFEAIKQKNYLLTHVSVERIKDEFVKIIMSDHPRHGVQMLHDTGLLQHFLPELEDGIGVEQNHHHTLTVWEHNLQALEKCPSKKLEVRLATLFHDIGKPKSKRGKGRDCTFYNHEYISARMTKTIMKRLHFPTKVTQKTVLLVKNHMFYYSVDEVTEAAVRRIIKKVGLENMKDLMDVRIGDRLGSGTPKAKPYKLRHFEYIVEKVSKDPISVKMLKLNGDIMINDLRFEPGPQIGAILNVLLAEVIEDPSKNTLEYLSKRALSLKDEDLNKLKNLAKEKIKEKQTEEEENIKKKHWVK
jgi:poly(A) polymerase/tRNA nucleotidyltransferase (CCA-adding enzyme)